MFLIKIPLLKIPKMSWKLIYSQSLTKKLEIVDENKLIKEENNKIPPKPQPPQEPEPYECCGSGCQNCVLDLYYSKLEKYERELIDWIDCYGDLANDDN